MSFHGRAPQRIQQAMHGVVPQPRNMYSAGMNPQLPQILRGYHPTEAVNVNGMTGRRSAQPADPWGPAESWNQLPNERAMMTDIGPFADRDMRPLRNINRETPPSTAANSPVSAQRAYLPPGAIDVTALPPRGANFTAKEMAQYLVNNKLQTAGIVAGGVLGTGLVGMGVNGLQGDSNGNLIQNPITQAALLAGSGAGLGYGAVDMYQGQVNRTARGFEQPDTSRRGRHRAYGALAGTAAGALTALTTQLNDRLQTEMY